MRKKRNLYMEIGFVLAAFAVGVGFSIKPWRKYQDQRAATARQLEETRQAENRIEELVRKKSRLDTELGREEQARKQGYKRPNELPVTFD